MNQPQNPIQKVTVVDVDMSVGSLMFLMFQLVFASLPASLIVVALLYMFGR